MGLDIFVKNKIGDFYDNCDLSRQFAQIILDYNQTYILRKIGIFANINLDALFDMGAYDKMEEEAVLSSYPYENEQEKQKDIVKFKTLEENSWQRPSTILTIVGKLIRWIKQNEAQDRYINFIEDIQQEWIKDYLDEEFLDDLNLLTKNLEKLVLKGDNKIRFDFG